MPHEFTEWPYEPEAQPSARMGRRPPGKRIGTDLLEPGKQPAAPPEPFMLSPETLRFLAILMGSGGALALLGYAIWFFIQK